MSKSDNTVWFIIGGVAFMVMASQNSDGLAWGSGWMWPVPSIRYPDGTNYPAVISNGFQAGPHYGVDIMFERRVIGDRTELPAGTPNGSTMFFAPPGTPVVAARDARVWSVDKSARGWEVVLDHGAPWATYYQHLATVLLPIHQGGKLVGANGAQGAAVTVKAGEQIGTMGGDPTDTGGHQLRHLHFAVWHAGAGDRASVDPAKAMRSWARPPVWLVV